MDTQDIVDEWRNEVKREAAEDALSRAVIRLYEARFGAMPADLRKLIEDTHGERTLDDWNVLAGTGSAEDLAAAVPASRAS